MPRLYRAARPDEVATLAGVPAAPPNVRLARSKAALVERGGRRVTVNLSPGAAAALALIRALGEHPTDTSALEDALAARAKSLRKGIKWTPPAKGERPAYVVEYRKPAPAKAKKGRP